MYLDVTLSVQFFAQTIRRWCNLNANMPLALRVESRVTLGIRVYGLRHSHLVVRTTVEVWIATFRQSKGTRERRLISFLAMLLFPPFHAPEKWRAVDDRIRGGSSTSHLEPIRHKSKDNQDGVRFHGELG